MKWLKLALLATILYIAGILGPLAAFIFAIQKDLILRGVASGNIVVIAVCIALALAIGLFGWLKRLAERI